MICTSSKRRFTNPVGAAVFVITALSGLTACESGASDTTALDKVESALTASSPSINGPASTGGNEAWNASMSRVPVPRNGCFRAIPPDTRWEEVPCVPTPVKARRRNQRAAGPALVGNGVDGMIFVNSGNITSATGSFPTVTNVTNENIGGQNDAYSLQLNSNFVQGASLCNGAQNPATCSAWQQFMLNSGSPTTSSYIFIQYWLLNFNNTCPTNWIRSPTSVGNDCVFNSQSTNVPFQPIANLASLKLTASSTSSDVVQVSTGSGLFARSLASVFNLQGIQPGWTGAEFNVVGDCCLTEAVFNTGATITTQLTVVNGNGSTASPLCVISGTTGETNSLTLVPESCCPFGSSASGILFTQTSASGVSAPFCLLKDLPPALTPLL